MTKATALDRALRDIRHYEDMLNRISKYSEEYSFAEWQLAMALQYYDEIVNTDYTQFTPESKTVYTVYRTLTESYADAVITNTENLGNYDNINNAELQIQLDRKFFEKCCWINATYYIEISTIWF